MATTPRSEDLIAEARAAEDWSRFPARKTAELIYGLRTALEVAEKRATEAEARVAVLRERDAEKWDEGAKWAAVELGAIDNERQAWITPSDNPYRRTEEEK